MHSDLMIRNYLGFSLTPKPEHSISFLGFDGEGKETNVC
jgi:hypothetical protein